MFLDVWPTTALTQTTAQTIYDIALSSITKPKKRDLNSNACLSHLSVITKMSESFTSTNSTASELGEEFGSLNALALCLDEGQITNSEKACQIFSQICRNLLRRLGNHKEDHIRNGCISEVSRATCRFIKKGDTKLNAQLTMASMFVAMVENGLGDSIERPLPHEKPEVVNEFAELLSGAIITDMEAAKRHQSAVYQALREIPASYWARSGASMQGLLFHAQLQDKGQDGDLQLCTDFVGWMLRDLTATEQKPYEIVKPLVLYLNPVSYTHLTLPTKRIV